MIFKHRTVHRKPAWVSVTCTHFSVYDCFCFSEKTQFVDFTIKVRHIKWKKKAVHAASSSCVWRKAVPIDLCCWCLTSCGQWGALRWTIMSWVMRCCSRWNRKLASAFYLQCNTFRSGESWMYTCIGITALTVINVQEYFWRHPLRNFLFSYNQL